VASIGNTKKTEAFENSAPTALPVACIRTGRRHELIQKLYEAPKIFALSDIFVNPTTCRSRLGHVIETLLWYCFHFMNW